MTCYPPGPAYDTEILLTDVEQPKHLLTYDLGLAKLMRRGTRA